jgi:glycosyltransferase involved in cell wall biosynthesis
VSAVYAFDTAALETFEWAARNGIARILEQCVVPRTGQERILSALMARSGQPASAEMVAAWRHLAAREQAEWKLADRIVCPSEFVRREILAAGGAAEKVCVVPYGVEPPGEEKFSTAMQARRAAQARPLRVLFAGEVGVRKGILDVAATAAQLPAGACEFRAAGRINLTEKQRGTVERSVKVLGPLGKAQLEREYAEADVFLLPSYLEGSATVTYEALGWGLPVVTTHEAGSVVENAVSGFVSDAGDIAALARHLATLSHDATMRSAMSEAARRRSLDYDIAAYGRRLGAVLDALSR